MDMGMDIPVDVLHEAPQAAAAFLNIAAVLRTRCYWGLFPSCQTHYQRVMLTLCRETGRRCAPISGKLLLHGRWREPIVFCTSLQAPPLVLRIRDSSNTGRKTSWMMTDPRDVSLIVLLPDRRFGVRNRAVSASCRVSQALLCWVLSHPKFPQRAMVAAIGWAARAFWCLAQLTGHATDATTTDRTQTRQALLRFDPMRPTPTGGSFAASHCGRSAAAVEAVEAGGFCWCSAFQFLAHFSRSSTGVLTGSASEREKYRVRDSPHPTRPQWAGQGNGEQIITSTTTPAGKSRRSRQTNPSRGAPAKLRRSPLGV